MFTARSRQRANPFAARSRQKAAAQKPPKVVAPPEPAPVPEPEPAAAPFDRNPESEEYNQAPDISTYAAGGIVELPDTIETVPVEVQAELVEIAKPVLSPETRAKIDAVMNHAIPPVDDEQIAEVTADEPAIDAKRGRGRPRPPETIARDNAVHALLVEADPETGISKEQIAVKLNGEKEQQVYSSLRQLTKEGRAETRYVKPHGYRWFAV